MFVIIRQKTSDIVTNKQIRTQFKIISQKKFKDYFDFNKYEYSYNIFWDKYFFTSVNNFLNNEFNFKLTPDIVKKYNINFCEQIDYRLENDLSTFGKKTPSSIFPQKNREGMNCQPC